jgi:hypothetical protein
MKPLARLFVITFFCGAMLATSQADPDSARTNRLFRKLESLPADGAPFSTVDKLLMHLIRRDPIAAYKYIQMALSRIAWEHNLEAMWTLAMQKRAWLIVKYSNLPPGQKDSVLKNVNRSFQDLWWPRPPTSPTPSPTP